MENPPGLSPTCDQSQPRALSARPDVPWGIHPLPGQPLPMPFHEKKSILINEPWSQMFATTEHPNISLEWIPSSQLPPKQAHGSLPLGSSSQELLCHSREPLMLWNSRILHSHSLTHELCDGEAGALCSLCWPGSHHADFQAPGMGLGPSNALQWSQSLPLLQLPPHLALHHSSSFHIPFLSQRLPKTPLISAQGCQVLQGALL